MAATGSVALAAKNDHFQRALGLFQCISITGRIRAWYNVSMDKKNNAAIKSASWSGAGFAIGFTIGYLVIDSIVSAIILGIGLALAMGLATRPKTK